MTFENIEVAHILGAIRGMRNPMMSHAKSDSWSDVSGHVTIGPEDAKLARALIRGGKPHRKFLRQISVMVDICKAPAYWMHEFATYKVGTTLDCSSTMHKITSRPLTKDDFEMPETDLEKAHLGDVIEALNICRENYLLAKSEGNDLLAEMDFRALKRMLPHSYLYERLTWTCSYENLLDIWEWRHTHRLPVWHLFCEDFIEKLPYAGWITGDVA